MDNLKGNVINEIQKLFLKKKIIAFLVIMMIMGFLPGFFISVIQQKVVFIALNSISFPQIILSIITNVFLPLFIFICASELFSGEEGDKTIKLVLTRPISRFKVFLSKNLALFVYVIISLILILIVSTLSAVLLGLSIDSISKVIFSYLIDIIPALILAIFSTFMVQFFKSSSGALISCILTFIGINILTLFIKGFNNIIFTSYLNWYSHWAADRASFLVNINLLLMLLGYGIIFFTTGFYLFDKKEF